MVPTISKEEIPKKISTFCCEDIYKIITNDLNNDDVRSSKHKGTGPRKLSSPKTLIKGGHQYCISKAAIENAAKKLEKVDLDGLEANSFEDIYMAVLEAVADVKGIGPLTIYDIAWRVAWLKTVKETSEKKVALMPRQYVYLHAGAYRGACEIFGKEQLIESIEYVRWHGRSCARIATEKLAEHFIHPPFGGFQPYWEEGKDFMPSWVIEDILCVEFDPKDETNPKRGCRC